MTLVKSSPINNPQHAYALKAQELLLKDVSCLKFTENAILKDSVFVIPERTAKIDG